MPANSAALDRIQVITAALLLNPDLQALEQSLYHVCFQISCNPLT